MELLAAHTELTKSHTAKHQKAVDMLKEVDAALYTKDHQDIPELKALGIRVASTLWDLGHGGAWYIMPSDNESTQE